MGSDAGVTGAVALASENLFKVEDDLHQTIVWTTQIKISTRRWCFIETI